MLLKRVFFIEIRVSFIRLMVKLWPVQRKENIVIRYRKNEKFTYSCAGAMIIVSCQKGKRLTWIKNYNTLNFREKYFEAAK